MKDSFSGSNIVVKVILLVIAIILILAVAFYAVIDGIKAQIFNFIGTLAETVSGNVSGFFRELARIPFSGDIKVYKVDEESLEGLKVNLEGAGIDTETCGLTPIRLRKILLANTVSTSFSTTLCIATVTEEEILANVKEKEEYKDINSLQEFLDNPIDQKNSNELWQGENLDYELYFDSEKFFYFQDEDNKFGSGENQWFLGAMGAIILEKQDGTDMKYAAPENFKAKGQDFLDAKDSWLHSDDFAEEQMLNVFTDGDSATSIKVWSIKTTQRMYDYTFKNSNIEDINQKGKDEEYEYSITPKVINLEDEIDVSSFSISIELMIDLLNITGSGEFLETFIDYALAQIQVDIKVYQTEEVQTTYEKQEYNIKENFTIEVYDFIDTGRGNISDIGNDNFLAYADIVYKRTYNGRPFEKVTDLLIQYGGSIDKSKVTLSSEETKRIFKENLEVDIDEILNAIEENQDNEEAFVMDAETVKTLLIGLLQTEEGKELLASPLGITTDKIGETLVTDLVESAMENKDFTYKTNYRVKALEENLKTAYDLGAGFSLGEITVTEGIRTRVKEVSYEVSPSSIKTWYGDIEYSEPEILNEYSLRTPTGEEVEITASEYSNFGYSNLERDTTAESSEARERMYISESLADQYEEVKSNQPKVEIYSLSDGGSDITDEIFYKKPGRDNKDHYDNWTSNGLFQIATKDQGTFNNDLGGTVGSDYVYLKYVKENIDIYKNATTIERELLNKNNITKSMAVDSTENKLKAFLGLLKNVDGTVPTGGTTKEFRKVKDGGKVVLYGDIYKGHIPAGDLLLDNGALMLFELLESNENTQGLVNTFKYLAYLYSESGTDYGITEVSQFTYLFSVGAYSGSDFIVNTGMSSEGIVLTKEQLTEAIEKTYSGQTKTNLLSCIDDFIYIQETDKVNAVFAMAVTIIESSGGTNWAAIDSSTYNWMSVIGSYNGNSYRNPDSPNPRTWRVYPSFNDATRDFGDLIANGSYYFKAGKYSVKEIAPTYYNEDWGQSVISEMTKIYNSIGVNVNTGGIEGVSGNVTTFTVGSRTYKNYKQIEDAYRSIPLANFPGTTLYNSGCAVTSVAIIATGFGQNVTPIDVNNYEASLGTTSHASVLSSYTGMNCTWVYSDIKNGVINQLKQGYPAMVYVGTNRGTFATSRQHFFTILSISEDGNYIYVSDPASRREGVRTGWIKTSVLNESAFQRYLKMEEN